MAHGMAVQLLGGGACIADVPFAFGGCRLQLIGLANHQRNLCQASALEDSD